VCSVFSVVKERKEKVNHREHGEHRDRGEVSLRAPAAILTLEIASVSSVGREMKEGSNHREHGGHGGKVKSGR